MSPEEREELMEFILKSQSDAAERHREMDKRQNKMQLKMMEQHKEAQKQIQENRAQIKALVAASHDLLKVARIHSRRLDRLDGFTG